MYVLLHKVKLISLQPFFVSNRNCQIQFLLDIVDFFAPISNAPSALTLNALQLC